MNAGLSKTRIKGLLRRVNHRQETKAKLRQRRDATGEATADLSNEGRGGVLVAHIAGKPRIRFSPEEVQVCIGDEVVRKKPLGRLFSPTLSSDWKRQIDYELAMLRGITY